MSGSLGGRRALVTGGGSGIGAAITGALADEGAAVFIWQRNTDEADQAVRGLRQADRIVHGSGGDLVEPATCRAAVQQCVARLGGIDILVNNAAHTGWEATGSFLDFTDERLDQVVDLNLKAAFRCSRHAALYMSASGGGVIINITSVAAFAAQDYAAAYTASKAGLAGLTKAMALELASHGVRVVAVAPGDIVTDASNRLLQNLEATGRASPFTRVTPVGQRGLPQDVASAVVFLCSDQAGFINGTSVIVDGGFLAY